MSSSLRNAKRNLRGDKCKYFPLKIADNDSVIVCSPPLRFINSFLPRNVFLPIINAPRLF